MNPEITVCISTKDRYFSTLPLTLVAICNQTYKPKHVLIFDDGEHKDLRSDPLYSQVFPLFDINGIKWEVVFGEGKGQVLNHIKSVEIAKTPWIWRCDDDNVSEPNVLEELVKCIDDKIGAVGGLVIEPNKYITCSVASSKLEDIYLGLNEQWFAHPVHEIKEVDHLYSSFIYRREIAEYCTELGPKGHREETLLTYSFIKKGYKNILNTKARTWHLKSPTGGIRSDNNVNDFVHDERIFSLKLNEWGIKPNDHAFVVLENGIGDHYVFKTILPQLLEKNKSKKYILFTTFPQVFADMDIQQGSIADAITLLGDISKYNIYRYMIDKKWNKHIADAYAEMYKVDKPLNRGCIHGVGDYVVISPYSQNPDHAKSYPWWDDLVKLIPYRLIQIGRSGEQKIPGTEFMPDMKFKEIEKLISNCKYWISGDNFLQHLVNCMDIAIKGVVIWGCSDPSYFGYNYNLNILQSKSNLRKNQFDVWNDKRNNNWFPRPQELVKYLTSI